MFGISGLELLLIAAFVLIIFGPDKIPELARLAGRAMRMFKSAQEDMERVIKAEMLSDTLKSPFEPLGSSEGSSPDTTAQVANATESASAVWAATAEDDDEEEEEDEE